MRGRMKAMYHCRVSAMNEDTEPHLIDIISQSTVGRLPPTMGHAK
jgi:hypothetical protein